MADKHSPLESEIRRRIGLAGPMTLGGYMELCLTHPEHGYYISRDPIGARGDFITAPEVSQMFGELVGVWMAAVWQQMGSPGRIRVIELGPGRGTMMLDALRAAKVAVGFRAAMTLHLVEISPTLRQVQERRLQALDAPIRWHDTISEIPEGPEIIIANEFIDALAVHQAVKQTAGWYERVVDIGADGELCFGQARDALPCFEMSLPRRLRDCPVGSIFEWRSDSLALELGRRVRTEGAALIFDYGHTQSGLGDTFQAAAGHHAVEPLRACGLADLTAHVDFEALAQSAEGIGGRVHGPIAQGQFLRRLGIEKRAAQLKARATSEQAIDIARALTRLTGGGSREMGDLFKVLAIADPKLAALPGFEPPS